MSARKMLDLNNITVTTLAEGKELVADIQQERRDTMQLMQGATGQAWQELCDRDYELKQALHNVRSQMTRIFKTQKGVI